VIAPLKFRHRIGILVALAAVALIAVTAVTLVLGSSVAQQLAGIETRYVPLVELDRDLKTLFTEIPRMLEDAAGAAEESGLRAADERYEELLRKLRAGWAVIVGNGANPAALEVELRVYYGHARAVAAALIAGTPASELTARIEVMVSAQDIPRPRVSPGRRRRSLAVRSDGGRGRRLLGCHHQRLFAEVADDRQRQRHAHALLGQHAVKVVDAGDRLAVELDQEVAVAHAGARRRPGRVQRRHEDDGLLRKCVTNHVEVSRVYFRSVTMKDVAGKILRRIHLQQRLARLSIEA